MGDHTHSEGEVMLSYRAMVMEMNGNRDGTDRVSSSEVLSRFMVTPLNMDMVMHMLGGMWAASDDLTLAVMVPYLSLEMDHSTRMGATFTTEAEGIGDITLAALRNVWSEDNHTIHLNAGIGLPTGSIDEKDVTPMGRVRLPYPMQLGSGTLDLKPGVTYLGHADACTWGGQVIGTLRLDENDNNYTLGNTIRATAWLTHDWSDTINTSIRVAAVSWDDIDGADPRLMPGLVPTADPELRGGERVDVGLGASVTPHDGALAGHRLAVEWLIPAHQDLDGPQLETDSTIIAGWQRVW